MLMTDMVYEEFESDLFDKSFPAHTPSEMYPIERRFLHGIIRKHRPQKLLEIGVAAGGSSLIILNAIHDMPDARLYSTDYSCQYHKDRLKTPGFWVAENHNDLTGKWTLFTGGLVSKFIDDIGDGIDFCLLDGAHQNPGEILDYLTILPYMKPEGIIAIHDTALYAQVRPNPKDGLNASFFESNGSPHPLTCGLLFAAMRGKKYLPRTLGGRLFLPNIAAVQLAPDAMEHVFSAFVLLTLPWVQHMNAEEQKIIKTLFSRYYSNDLIGVFDSAVAFNQQYRAEMRKIKEQMQHLERNKRETLDSPTAAGTKTGLNDQQARQLERLTQTIAHQHQEIERQRAMRQQLKQSGSWRVTAPFRWLGRLFKKQKT